MKLDNIKTVIKADDRAVSPVIGVILMVAITVILAAVIGTFVLGLSGNTNSAPQAQWQIQSDNIGDNDNTNDGVNILHQGGDAVNTDDLLVSIGGEVVYDDGAGQTSDDGYTINTNNWGSEVTASNNLRVNEDSASVTNGEPTVRIVWQNPDGDDTQILSQREVNFES
ncbi:type IV pilin [Halobacteriales archaeon SW_7_71_33]|nr:MAG: type IV pilin [Halobacteriales archaeon SW_7_71_33]